MRCQPVSSTVVGCEKKSELNGGLKLGTSYINGGSSSNITGSCVCRLNVYLILVRQEVIFQLTMGDDFSWGLMGIQGIKQGNSVGVSHRFPGGSVVDFMGFKSGFLVT